MTTRIVLTAMPTSTRFAPLGALGYCLTRTGFLDVVLNDVKLSVKRVDHAPQEKLLDGLVAVLAGCRAIYEINTRIRPDIALAQAWGRDRFAEQSNVSRALDAFTATPLEQLRQGSNALFCRESRTLRHTFAGQWLWLDIDLTPLPASKRAQGSTKGKIGGKKINMVVN